MVIRVCAAAAAAAAESDEYSRPSPTHTHARPLTALPPTPNGLVHVKVIRPKAATFFWGHPFRKYQFYSFFFCLGKKIT
jgi:hypothetical protein